MLEELQVQRLCSGEGGGGAVLLLENSREDNTLSMGKVRATGVSCSRQLVGSRPLIPEIHRGCID